MHTNPKTTWVERKGIRCCGQQIQLLEQRIKPEPLTEGPTEIAGERRRGGREGTRDGEGRAERRDRWVLLCFPSGVGFCFPWSAAWHGPGFIKLVSGSGLGRYQIGPNSKFKFEFRKMKKFQKNLKNTLRCDESNGVKFS